MKKYKLLGACFLLTFTTVQQSYAVDFYSPRTAALAGAGHAAPLLNDSLYLNPAYISFLDIYSFAYSYQSYTAGRNYNLSVVDGRSELFQGALGYTVKEQGVFVNAGGSLRIDEKWSGGVGGKMLTSNTEASPKVFDMMASVAFMPTSWMQFSFTGDNLLSPPKNQALALDREFTLGSRFSYLDLVHLYIDPHVTPGLTQGSTIGHNTGMEFVFLKDFSLRSGFFHNSSLGIMPKRGRGLGFGLGWLGPKISFDYSFQRILEVANENSPQINSHTFGTTIYF